jgi:hypothetical protein
MYYDNALMRATAEPEQGRLLSIEREVPGLDK